LSSVIFFVLVSTDNAFHVERQYERLRIICKPAQQWTM